MSWQMLGGSNTVPVGWMLASDQAWCVRVYFHQQTMRSRDRCLSWRAAARCRTRHGRLMARLGKRLLEPTLEPSQADKSHYVTVRVFLITCQKCLLTKNMMFRRIRYNVHRMRLFRVLIIIWVRYHPPTPHNQLVMAAIPLTG